MRFGPMSRSITVALFAAVTTLVAHAGTVFTFTPDDPSQAIYAYTFGIDVSTPVLAATDGVGIVYGNVPIKFTGLAYTGSVGFYDAGNPANAGATPGNGYDFLIFVPGGAGFNYIGDYLYTGSATSLTFLDGTYHLLAANGQPNGTLVVAQTPEPASLLLLGTGTLGALGVARRKLLKRA